jgi:hypothetical protein
LIHALRGETDKAEAMLQRAVAIAGPLGLFAEAVDAQDKFFGTICAQSCLGAAKPIPALRNDRRVSGGAVCSEETNVTRDHTSHYSDPHPDRCAADLALQLGMGLLSLWRTRIDPCDRYHPALAGTNIGRACRHES